MLQEMLLQPTVFVLWTCREGKELRDAIEWCITNNIPIAVDNDGKLIANRNHPSVHTWGYTAPNAPKIFANEYWDDKAVRIS